MTPEETQLEGPLRTSLELGSRALAVSVAHRAAMRVAPLDWCETHPVAGAEVSALRSLRLLLISCVACHVERQAIKQATVTAFGGMDFTAAKAARAAWTAVLACDTAPAIAPGTAVEAVSLAAEALGAGPTIQARHDGSVSHDGRSTYGSDLSKRELIWSLARRDVGTSSGQDAGTSLLGRRLWFDDRGPLADLWTGIRDTWSATGAGWQFWIDWYEAALDGRPLLGDWDRHWDLLTEIILTAGIDWNAPPDVVNARIAEIQLKYAIYATANAEVMSYNTVSGRLRVDPASELPKDHLAEAVERLGNVLVLFEGQAWPTNQFHPIETEIAIIRQAVSQFSARPRMVHSACLRVVRRLDIKFRMGECPEPDKDADIGDFYRTVVGVEADLIENDPLVREAANASAAANLPTLGRRDAEILVGAADALAKFSEGDLAQELPSDARAAVSPSLDPDARKEAFFITASRLLRAWALIGYRGSKKVLEEIESLTETAAGICKNAAIIAGSSALAATLPAWLDAAVQIVLQIFT